MFNFGVGVYFLSIIWFITFMLCWVSVRTGHFIGKVAVTISIILTIVLVSLPKGDEEYTSANFYDKTYIPRFTIFALLLISVVAGGLFSFIYACLAPVETHKVKTFGSNNQIILLVSLRVVFIVLKNHVLSANIDHKSKALN